MRQIQSSLNNINDVYYTEIQSQQYEFTTQDSISMIAGFSIMFESTAEGPEGYESEKEDDIYTTYVEKDAVEEEGSSSYTLTEDEMLVPPNLPNGGGGSSCPYGTWSNYDECLSYNGWDKEHCDCVCLVNGPCGDGLTADLVEFFDYLGIEGVGNVGMCILGLIGVGTATFAAAASGGALLPVVILVVVPAAWQCNVAIGEINSCI